MTAQLGLDVDHATDLLRRLQAAMIARFGRIVRPDNKRRDPVWTLVQGLVGARTRTAASNANTDRLIAHYGSWESVAQAPLGQLASLLASATYPNVAAERLKACLTAIVDERAAADLRHLSNLPTAEAMNWLEKLPGVGRKIAAGVMNTSHFERRAMVIDGHHGRIMQRMGLVPPKADTVRIYDILMPVLPREWSAVDMDEHHLLLKKVGQSHCRPRGPACGGCPAAADCATAQRASKS